MDVGSMEGGDTSGPEGEPFAEEERKRKYIIGSVALVVGLVATLVLIYAFGLTSADVEDAGESGGEEAATKQKSAE